VDAGESVGPVLTVPTPYGSFSPHWMLSCSLALVRVEQRNHSGGGTGTRASTGQFANGALVHACQIVKMRRSWFCGTPGSNPGFTPQQHLHVVSRGAVASFWTCLVNPHLVVVPWYTLTVFIYLLCGASAGVPLTVCVRHLACTTHSSL
jgi:hypothetical protein